MHHRLPILCLLMLSCCSSFSQKTNNGVYVDKLGVLRWQKDNREAAFFGVNYTTPFAYAYRAHKALQIDLEKAIQQDVYHLARLGLDAFRVHVWDTEITDSAGNLLQNDHLRLFDFLLAELKKRNIKTIITPIAFWGNGYPERDENTPGFSRKYGKGRATVNDSAITAQENYLKQFFTHVNPYTKLNYKDDPDILAVELNNEPSHSGPKPGITAYINRLVVAIKTTGFTKPLFYNISQNPYYADAVAASNVNGVSFQWYPSGLVANHEVKGNFLPNVDVYAIPFDTIAQYRNKARMVYEFDAADLLQSNMYPAIARSYRSAGFQWATQFAYDPMALAYANTEYQTHYLNLAFTPSKAISLLIASRAFHQLPRLKSYGSFPTDTLFDVFRVSYKESLSEMNSGQEFYYSNSTSTQPVAINKLQHIAGVGSSQVVQYKGCGAYFLDKIGEGLWRLELMPDAIHIRDPFERASPGKEVTRIQWQKQSMEINLPDLSDGFMIKGLNDSNNYSATADGKLCYIEPGTYLVRSKKSTAEIPASFKVGPIGLNEFVAPASRVAQPFLRHDPYAEVSAGKAFTISAIIVGIDSMDKVSVQLSRMSGPPRTLAMLRTTPYEYAVEVPADFAVAGFINYKIIIQGSNNDYLSFPGNHPGNPSAWDYYFNETWQTFVANEKGKLEIYNAGRDRSIFIYPSFRRNFETRYLSSQVPGQLLLRMGAAELGSDHVMGFQHLFGDKLKGRSAELPSFKKIIVRARTTNGTPVRAKMTLVTTDAAAYSAYFDLGPDLKDIPVSLTSLQQDSALLLPRPYPGFMPLYFRSKQSGLFSLINAEKLEITIGSELEKGEWNKPYNIEIESVYLEKD